MSKPATRKGQLMGCFRRSLWWAQLLFLFAGLGLWAQQPTPKAPPETRRDNTREVLHGVEIADPYRWLEDQESPETRAWIDAQNEYT